MARLVNKLSDLAIRKASKPGYYGDGNGLWLQVSATGSKSWIFRFTITKKQREMGLGPVHTVGLSEARLKAKECRALLLEGKDPLELRKAAVLAAAIASTRAVSFDECVEGYLTAHSSSWKNEKHRKQWASTLNTYASPLIGSLPVAAIDTGLVVKVLTPIWLTKTETATRVRGRIEAVLDWATVSKHRQGDNPARWRGHLDNLLANPSKVKKVEHHPALPWQEIGAFMADLRGQAGVAARATELAILTATRSGEVRGAEWSEFDLDAGLWTIPADRMKAGREHRVPLSKGALALLRETPRLGNFVFPGARPSKPLSDMSLTAVLRRMGRDDITVHGFRSTFRDWCAESVANSFSREVCEHALAHSLPDKVEAAYRRGDLLEKRAMLMQAWDDYCNTIPTAATVTPLRGKTAA